MYNVISFISIEFNGEINSLRISYFFLLLKMANPAETCSNE